MWTLPLLILSLLLCALPVRAQVWPNEPSGSTVISDYGFDNIFQPSDASGSFAGWTSFCESCTSVDSVAAGAGPAPFSGPIVGQWRYRADLTGGISAGNLFRSLPGVKQIYVGFWWKASAGWVGHPSNVNKLGFVVGGGNFVPEMFGSPGGPYQLMLGLEMPVNNCHLPASNGDCPGTRNSFPNVTNVPLVPGNWYRIEFCIAHSTTPTSQDGKLKGWVNGTQTHNHNNINTQSQGWTKYQVNPTYGGTGSTPGQVQFFWYDHIHISSHTNRCGAGPGGGTPPSYPDTPAGPPGKVTDVTVTVQ